METSDNDPVAADMGAWETAVQERDSQGASSDEVVSWLLDAGFSKRLIAALLNVSYSDVQRWYSTCACTEEDHRRLLRLQAFHDVLKHWFGMDKPVAWLETRLVESCVITPQEMYALDQFGLLMDLAAGRKDAEQVLDLFDEGWRKLPPTMWEVLVNNDGETYIARKGGSE